MATPLLGPHYIEIVTYNPLICGHGPLYNGQNLWSPMVAIIEGFHCNIIVYIYLSLEKNFAHESR